MKKAAGILIKVVAGFIVLLLVAMLTIPVIFKEKISRKVEAVINESVNARVTFGGYNLSFFKNFPNLAFSLNEIYVIGIGQFEGDTLAGFKSLSLVFNLGSLLGDSGYEIKSIILDKAVINGIVLKDGTPNWDIMKPSEETVPVAEQVVETQTAGAGDESTMKVLLRKFQIRESVITYNDASMNLSAVLNNLNYTLSGNMTLSETDLNMALTIDGATVKMDGINYLNKAKISSDVSLKANLDSMKFIFAENFFSVNDLSLKFAGTVAMPGDDIVTDVTFGTDQTSFKTLLSLVPAFYMTGYEGLRADGSFTLDGLAKGVYSDADSTLPDVKLNLAVKDGVISYPDLPEKITAINLNTDIFVNGTDLDLTTVNLDKFHFELAGNPFRMTFNLRTPMSDPDFRGTFDGKIDLKALSEALPMEDMKLSGIIEMAVNMAGKLSMIEKEQYESFTAKGTMGIKNMLIAMAGYPAVEIRDASFIFTPAYTTMEKLDILVAGSSDFLLKGNVENYIPYVFRNETIRGKLSLVSSKVDVTAILNAMAVDTAAVVEDTTALAVIAVPRNIDFDFNSQIASLVYDNIRAENLRGRIIVRDGVVSLRETGMAVIGGTIVMNADYDTRDTLKPVVKADFEMRNIDIKEAFNTFVTVQKFAPAAKGLEGQVSLQMKYESLLGSNMMPVINSINGSGRLQSDQVQIIEAPAFDKFREVLKLGDNFTNTFKDINISFRISDGRVFVSPFDVRMGTVKMNLSGDQGLDLTMNYLVRTEIPRAALGASVNSLVDNLTAQASAFGIAYKPAETIKVNVRVRGIVGKPEISPEFGSGGEGAGAVSTLKETVKETVKQTVTETIDKGKEALRKEAEAQGDRLIGEAELRGRQLRDEADRAATKLKEEAESEAAKLMAAAEPKGAIAKAAARKAADALTREAERRGTQLRQEADKQAIRLVDEAKAKKEDLIKKTE